MSYLCEACNKEFPKTPQGRNEWLAHRATHQNTGMGTPGKTATGEEVKRSMSAKEIKEKRTPKPIELTYQWAGECPDCFTPLESLLIQAGQEKGKAVAVAFCSRCKKQVRERVVSKL